MPTDLPTIEPCPFCVLAGKEGLDVSFENRLYTTVQQVHCNTCGSYGPSTMFMTPEQAIKRWNMVSLYAQNAVRYLKLVMEGK